MRKAPIILATAALLLLVMPAAMAGNMAITTFDSFPEEFEAGRTYTLTYTVLQHGRTPVTDAETALLLSEGKAKGKALRFDGVATGEPGRYTVEVTLPSEGNWHLVVIQGPFPEHDFGVISVGPASAATATDWMDVARWSLPLLALVAAIYTLREVASTRRAPAGTNPETG